MGYIGRQDLDKFVNEELDKIKEIENSTTEKIKGFKKEINSQYEEFEKKTDKRVQDFINTKNKINGIAGLDENGKIKKEQLPKIQNGMFYKGGIFEDYSTVIKTAESTGEKTYVKAIQFEFTPKLTKVLIGLGNDKTENCAITVTPNGIFDNNGKNSININWQGTSNWVSLKDIYIEDNFLKLKYQTTHSGTGEIKLLTKVQWEVWG